MYIHIQVQQNPVERPILFHRYALALIQQVDLLSDWGKTHINTRGINHHSRNYIMLITLFDKPVRWYSYLCNEGRYADPMYGVRVFSPLLTSDPGAHLVFLCIYVMLNK